MKKRILSQCCNVPTAVSKSDKKGTRIICSHCGKNINEMPKRKINPEHKKFDIYNPKYAADYIEQLSAKYVKRGYHFWFPSSIFEPEPRIINLKQQPII